MTEKKHSGRTARQKKKGLTSASSNAQNNKIQFRNGKSVNKNKS